MTVICRSQLCTWQQVCSYEGVSLLQLQEPCFAERESREQLEDPERLVGYVYNGPALGLTWPDKGHRVLLSEARSRDRSASSLAPIHNSTERGRETEGSGTLRRAASVLFWLQSASWLLTLTRTDRCWPWGLGPRPKGSAVMSWSGARSPMPGSECSWWGPEPCPPICTTGDHGQRSATGSRWGHSVSHVLYGSGSVLSQPVLVIGLHQWGGKPVLNWAHVCSPNILRTVRRTMIRFLIELLVRRTWFGQFDKLYFVINWLVMRCKLRPELVADAQQTAWLKM